MNTCTAVNVPVEAPMMVGESLKRLESQQESLISLMVEIKYRLTGIRIPTPYEEKSSDNKSVEGYQRRLEKLADINSGLIIETERILDIL